ncbi:HVA22-like protein i isoform X2 [Mangifera indica]|nr:HVA22-like protein i isoform X2 [Mangifera indica]
MVLGYAYPAYECYKTVEMNKPEIEQLRFWCQYWILVAVLSVCERIGDAFISWVPMYSEAKLAFFIYLWYPKTKGTTYVYDSFFRPYVAKHENEIDRNLLELRTKAGDMAILYWQRAASYGQSRVFEILQYVASQSTPRPPPAQQQPARARQPPVPNRQPATATQPMTEEPPSPTSSTSSSQHQKEVAEEVGPSQVPEAAPPARTNSLKANSATSNTQKANPATSNAQKSYSAVSNAQKANSTSSNAQKANSAASNVQKANSAASNVQKANSASESSSQTMPTEPEAVQLDLVSSAADENANPPPKETVMEKPSRKHAKN